MGLTIYYSGIIKDVKLLPALVAEVQDICTIMDWRSHEWDDFDLKGIVFTPPECETVTLCFTPEGQLMCPQMKQFNIPYDGAFTKTQFAGPELHQVLVHLFHHLSKTYFSHFEMKDESGYWETGDEKKLRQMFGVYNLLIDTTAEAMQNYNGKQPATAGGLVQLLEKLLRERWGKNE